MIPWGPYRSLRNRGFEYPADLIVRHAVCNETHKIATRFCPDQKRRSSSLARSCRARAPCMDGPKSRTLGTSSGFEDRSQNEEDVEQPAENARR